MNRYDIGRKLGEGSFGTVFYATKKRTGEERAIKCIRKESSWEGIHRMRELQSILCVPKHPNVVQLYEVHRECDGLARFVFEYMPSGSLLDMMEDRAQKQLGPPPDMEVRKLVYQILQGVQHLHLHGIFHRDIKPENVLLAGSVCKVADFSLACEHDEEGPPTSYISTRWYRAPEILLASKKYSSAVDIWAIGCIAAELYSLEPLFPGNDEIHQLRLIFEAMGTPKMVGWDEGTALLEALRVRDWQCPTDTTFMTRDFLQSALNVTDTVIVDFVLTLLMLDPAKRSDASGALSHDIFHAIHCSNNNSMTSSKRCKPLQEISLLHSALSFTSNVPTPSPGKSNSNVVTISKKPLHDISDMSMSGTKRKNDDAVNPCSLLSRNPYVIGKKRKQSAP